MSLVKLTPDDFEYFTLETHPKKTYSSGSSGITGSQYLFARRSSIEKEVATLSSFNSLLYSDDNLENLRNVAVQKTSSNIHGDVESYITAVNAQQSSARKKQKLEIYRFNPPFSLNTNFLRKTVVREHLMPYYRAASPSANYAATNYNTLNFFTSSNTPTDSVLLYPNKDETYNVTDSGFSFDFFIKPTINKAYVDGEVIEAGSILHLSSSFCISLHTGSLRDINFGKIGYRLGVQIGEDSDVNPSVMSGSDRTFFSTDNSLRKDEWHHVTITWGGPNYNNTTGSIIINNVPDTYFTIPSIRDISDPIGEDPAYVLCVGNYYEGENQLGDSLSRFFGNDISIREGLVELTTGTGFSEPNNFTFTQPLYAEVHDLKLYDKYLTLSESIALSSTGPQSLENLKLYIPPFFTTESPVRQFEGTSGGILVTPFFTKDGTTTTPFATDMAYSCGGQYINLENYTRDLATGNYPRLWSLTGSAWTPPSTTILSANDFLFATGSNIKRQYTILPSDNGTFTPNFNLLADLSSERFVNDLGNKDLGIVSLNNMISEDLNSRSIHTTGSILDDVLGAQPSNLGTLPGNSLAIYHRTRDTSSNQVVLFDISNMFYGMQIKPGSFSLKCEKLSYVDFGFAIKDDGEGNLYRTSLSSSYANPTWASIGNIFYNEGIIILKSPSLYFFGEQDYELEFEGVQNIHVMTINAFARPLMQTSSSNPAYLQYPADTLANNQDKDFVYITGINIHDENLNVIARTKLAQPVVKRTGDKMLFKVKMDF